MLNIFIKNLILDVPGGSKYASELIHPYTIFSKYMGKV